jgi:hypothetical protein
MGSPSKSAPDKPPQFSPTDLPSLSILVVTVTCQGNMAAKTICKSTQNGPASKPIGLTQVVLGEQEQDQHTAQEGIN